MIGDPGIMRVVSDAGTDLTIEVTYALGRGGLDRWKKGIRLATDRLVCAFVSQRRKLRTEPSSWTEAT